MARLARDTDAEMASVYYSQRPVGGRGQHHGDDCSGWICKRKSGAKPGSYAGWALLHSGLLSGRWHNYDAILVVPAAAQASLAQVQAQLMPAAQAVQAVSKAYVDQSIAEVEGSLLLAAGGTLSGPLYLNGDPTQPLQAADKHYVDTTSAKQSRWRREHDRALQTPAMNGEQSPLAGSSQTTLQAAIMPLGAMVQL